MADLTALIDTYFDLDRLIARLENEDPNLVLPIGFAEPHSYRGYYDELAFEPRTNISVGDMLAAARSALGQTFTGYKGGEFTMSGSVTCWIAYWVSSGGQQIGSLLMDLLLKQAPADEAVSR